MALRAAAAGASRPGPPLAFGPGGPGKPRGQARRPHRNEPTEATGQHFGPGCEDHRMPLPQPDDLTSLGLRTDFSDDHAWADLKVTIDNQGEYPAATYVSDPAYTGITIGALVEADAAAQRPDKVTYLFVADATTMADDEHLLLAVDLYDEPGRTFRVPPQWFYDISTNLCIANMCFHEFADAVDSSGTYRGFEGEPPR